MTKRKGGRGGEGEGREEEPALPIKVVPAPLNIILLYFARGYEWNLRKCFVEFNLVVFDSLVDVLQFVESVTQSSRFQASSTHLHLQLASRNLALRQRILCMQHNTRCADRIFPAV